ncbi:hypothetical protein ASD16_07195 [Cellulomonas sp. Root485]|uniref:hypothetical protein n=1 Tax=Cellulomonas sp. Root485 TaxID=1736546 RepID=UPI0007020CAE|nr:hypothetical protein [Cellulomonas sp. Root485]KQY25672.1 hypothetical protein ASD16_07195 [Cellulomonas sp. Root485]
MRALLVYESSFGNTARVAGAVWEGMFSEVQDVSLLEVGAAPTRLPDEVELLVVGAPTQAFGMSRPVTRADAQVQAGTADRGPTIGVREWLATLERPGRPVRAATFDTRVRTPHLPGSAAAGASRVLRRTGFDIPTDPETFWVLGVKGPLRDGELERARSWGVSLMSLVPGGRPPGS